MSKKDAYYFSHDCNAKEDFKCMLVIEEMGLEGYGIFWVLIETLREQDSYSYPLRLLPILARKYNTTFPKIELIVRNYNLFEIDDKNFFFSKSLNERMSIMNDKREKARQAGIKSGEARRLKNEQKSNGRSTNVKLLMNNKSKEKESKEKEIKDIALLKKLSCLSANEIALKKVNELGLSTECIKIVNDESLSLVITYAMENTKYLVEKLENIKRKAIR